MSNPKHFIITVGDYHDSRGRFFSLRTPFHRPLNRALHRIGASWDKEIKCWLLQYNKPNWLQLQKTVAPFGSLEVLTRKLTTRYNNAYDSCLNRVGLLVIFYKLNQNTRPLDTKSYTELGPIKRKANAQAKSATHTLLFCLIKK